MSDRISDAKVLVLFCAAEPALTVGSHRFDDLNQCLSLFGQGILDFRRYLSIGMAPEHMPHSRAQSTARKVS